MSGGIFVSYRRADSRHVAGRLGDRLVDHFGPERVFIDVETIEPGADFGEAVIRALGASRVLVVVIGPGWLSAVSRRGGRRLDDPDDLVRVEVGTALERGLRVIPVLVEDAVMPGWDELPSDLAGLARRNALPVRHETFRDDAKRLVTALEQALAAGPARAERLAASIDDKSLRARALCGGARAVAATAPERAASLVNEATRLAGFTADARDQARVQAAVASATAALDCTAAEAIAVSVAEPASKAWALCDVARAAAVTDRKHAAGLFDAAARACALVDDAWLKASAMMSVTVETAAVDPAQAVQFVDGIAVPALQAAALAAIGRELTKQASAPRRPWPLIIGAPRSGTSP